MGVSGQPGAQAQDKQGQLPAIGCPPQHLSVPLQPTTDGSPPGGAPRTEHPTSPRTLPLLTTAPLFQAWPPSRAHSSPLCSRKRVRHSGCTFRHREHPGEGTDDSQPPGTRKGGLLTAGSLPTQAQCQSHASPSGRLPGGPLPQT